MQLYMQASLRPKLAHGLDCPPVLEMLARSTRIAYMHVMQSSKNEVDNWLEYMLEVNGRFSMSG
jgi:hypothetical protein